MAETKSIDDILSDKADEPAAAEPVEQETSEERVRDERGRFAKAEAPVEEVTPEPPGEVAAPPAAPVAQNQPPHGYVPVSALIDQRLEARQEKQRVAELQRRLEEIERAKTQEPVDFFTDPQAALKQSLDPFESRLQSVTQNLTLRASRAEAIAMHGRETFNKMEEAIGEAMEKGDPEMPMLRQQMMQSDDPAGVAMSWYQRRVVLNEVGNDPAAYRERIRAELMAEMNGKPAVQQPAPVMPTPLEAARNVGSRTGPTWAGPTPLGDIFKR